MIVDHIKNINQYTELKSKSDKILKFIKQMSDEALKVGRYELEGEELFALVQRYSTKNKSDCKMESHGKYIDLQYVVKGQEMMYCDFADELTAYEDKLEESDIIFYEKRPEKVSILLQEGMFVLLYPNDAHMSCCQVVKEEKVEKIVFKIKA